jgi:hypothetical protein
MDDQTLGIIGGLVGSGIGILGGALGTWFSIRNTKGPRERAFMIRCAAIGWVLITLFLGLMFALPAESRGLLWIPYIILLGIGLRYGNRRQREIAESERSE